MQNVNQILNDLKSAAYCCRKIIYLNQELEELNHAILGLSHNRPRLSPEQEKSMKPMPVYHGGYTSPLAILEKIDIREAELSYYRRRLNECKPIELLSFRDQNILFDLYFYHMRQWDVADKYGYTRDGLLKHIRHELRKLV